MNNINNINSINNLSIYHFLFCLFNNKFLADYSLSFLSYSLSCSLTVFINCINTHISSPILTRQITHIAVRIFSP